MEKNIVKIGNKLFEIRKKRGLTQAQVAEAANLSDRTYADIERGNVNMRVETMLSICEALNVTPNDIFIDAEEEVLAEEKIIEKLEQCTASERKNAMEILNVFLRTIRG